MMKSSCSCESEVTKSVRSGTWPEELRTHVAGCTACKEIVRASEWMQGLAREPEKNLMLPDASLLWWRAQLVEEQAKAEKAQEFVEWVEIIAAGVFAAGIAGWIGWNWNAVQLSFTPIITETLPQLWTDPASTLNAIPGTLSAGILILSVAVIAVAYSWLVAD